MPYRIVPCRFVDGERYRLLVDGQTGVPLWYPNLYVTTQVRNASKSVATMDSCLRCIKVLLEYCDDRQIDLEERIRLRSAELLSLPELDGLRAFCQRNFEAADRKRFRRKSAGTILTLPAAAPPRVSKAYEYQRLSYIADYLGWYARLPRGRLSLLAEYEAAITNTEKAIHARRPHFKFSAAQRDKALEDWQYDLVMATIEPGHPENPFKAEDVAIRNALIIHLLLALGIRRGELLGIRVGDIQLRDRLITIHRRPDDPDDSRSREPNTKTLARTLEFEPELASRILDYIMKIRRPIPQARRHKFLLVVHGHGPNRGKPLGTSGLGKIFHTIRQANPALSGLHPHALRHTFNWRLSQTLDRLPKDQRLSPAEEAQMRNYFNGWQQGSGSAANYNRRHIERQAREAGRLLQRKMYSPMGAESDE